MEPINFYGISPGERFTIIFWARANNQHYASAYYVDEDRFVFQLHGKKVRLDKKMVSIIKEKLLKTIGNMNGDI